MSQFSDDMIDDGFDDPEEYLDYLCSQSDLAEMRADEESDIVEFYNQPHFLRRLVEPVCPYCNNDVEITSDHEVVCMAFPICSFRKEINNSDFYYDFEIKSFYDRRKKDYYLKIEINNYSTCPNCGNELQKFKSESKNYQKCCGFPACKFMTYLESENNI